MSTPTATVQRTVRSVINDADQGATLTVALLMHAIELSYTTNAKRAQDLERKGARLRHRLFRARALECATILVDYYRRLGSDDDMMRWEKRRRLCESLAFNHRNSIANNIGAGSDHAEDRRAADPDD